MKAKGLTFKVFRLFLVVLILFFMSCKSAKRVIDSDEVNTRLSAKDIIKQHQNIEANFKTLQAKVRIDITQNEKIQGAHFTFRMEKDKVIWLSAPLNVARMMITSELLRFYNKLDNEYFDGNYKLLSDFVGVDFDFF